MNKRKKLNILWLSHLVPYPPKSGVLMRSHYLIKELSKHHKVDLLSFIQKPHLVACFGDEEKGLEIARKELSKYVNNQEYFKIPADDQKNLFGRYWLATESLFTKNPFTINWLSSDAFKDALIDHVAENKYDLVHFDTISLDPYRKYINNMPAVLDHHNIESDMLIKRSGNEKNLIKKLYYYQEGIRLRRYEKNVLEHYRHHITCSQEDSFKLEKLKSETHCKVIANGVSFPSKCPARTSNNQISLLFIGGLSWYPNRDAVEHFLNEIWPDIKNVVMNIRFDIVGKSPSAEIKAVAERDDSVRLHGFVEDISDFYSNATVYICPIRDGGGTKLKIIDAMANRVPLVSYSASCEGLELEHRRDALIAENSLEFRNFVLEQISQKEKAQKMADQAYWTARSLYDVVEIGSEYAKLCEEIATARK